MSPKSLNSIIHFSQTALMQPVIEYLKKQGVPVEKHLQQSGISSTLAGEDTAPIPRKLLFQFINETCAAEGIEDIGLLAGQTASLHMMGYFGQSLLDVKSVRDYLKQGCALINTVASGDYYWLTEEPELKQVHFCQSVLGLDTPDQVQNYLYTLLITINTIREVVDSGWSPTEITIPGMSPETTSKLAEHLPKTCISTEGQHASFTIPAAVLRRPMNTVVAPIATRKSSYSSPPLPQSFKASIIRIIEVLIITGHPDIASAAEAAELTTRTLQRKLMDSGLSYTDLLTQTRIRLAKQWIQDDEKSLKYIAAALGYSDPSNFSRAFRRITGLSPRAYRSGCVRV